MGRGRLLDQKLGLVDARFHTPMVAVFFVGAVAIAASCLGQAVLVPISEVGSLACAVGWLAACAAFCRGAGNAVTPRSRLVGVAGAVISGLLISMKLIPAIPGSFRGYEFIALGGWISIGAVLWIRRPR
jgi:hypothetical protein